MCCYHYYYYYYCYYHYRKTHRTSGSEQPHGKAPRMQPAKPTKTNTKHMCVCLCFMKRQQNH